MPWWLKNDSKRSRKKRQTHKQQLADYCSTISLPQLFKENLMWFHIYKCYHIHLMKWSAQFLILILLGWSPIPRSQPNSSGWTQSGAQCQWLSPKWGYEGGKVDTAVHIDLFSYHALNACAIVNFMPAYGSYFREVYFLIKI